MISVDSVHVSFKHSQRLLYVQKSVAEKISKLKKSSNHFKLFEKVATDLGFIELFGVHHCNSKLL
jgi:hypothetical protein